MTGVAPGSIDDLKSFFEEEIESAGYSAGRTEAEATEREAVFTGNGIRGGWRVNPVAGCEGASKVTLVVIRS